MAGGASYPEEGDESLITDINVTPLVDIVLVLLIVFMITVPTIVTIELLKEREMSIALPEASEARPLTERVDQIVVNVASSGQVMVGGASHSHEELRALLRKESAAHPGRATVLIRADKRCPWQYVVNVMNLCVSAKIWNYSVTASGE